MLGVLWPCERGRVRLEQDMLGGLRVVRALVPAGGRQSRRVARAARLLARVGVRRVLDNRDFDAAAALGRWGLCCVDASALYRHMAPQLILARLADLGLEPTGTVVALQAQRVSGELVRAAEQLCPVVRGIVIRAGAGSARLQQRLYARYGMAVDGRWKGNVISVCFDGPCGDGQFRLWPCTVGLGLTVEGIDVPAGLERDSFLCALWQAGGIKEGQLRVVACKCQVVNPKKS